MFSADHQVLYLIDVGLLGPMKQMTEINITG